MTTVWLISVVYTVSIVLCYRVTTIYPVKDLQDPVLSFTQYAKKVEKSMFEVAQSRVSWYAFEYFFMCLY